MHPIAPFAREAFAAGYARWPAPVTARVETACTTAVALACEHADDPGILEATLQLGSLEGAWATVFDRRDELAAAHIAAVTVAWRKAFTKAAIAAAVKDFRDRPLAESRDAGVLERAVAAAKRLLSALPLGTAWAALRFAMRDTVAAGRAEGAVGAVAVAAETAEQTSSVVGVSVAGIDWDIAFTNAYDRLADLDDLWGEADGWLGRILDRSAVGLGRALANAAQAGASYTNMLTTATDVLTGADANAVSFVVDWALNTGLAQGALDLYRGEGVTRVSWLTAGDGRVCPRCQRNEDNSPWPIEDFPNCPDHPLCRCVPSAEFDLRPSLLDMLTAT